MFYGYDPSQGPRPASPIGRYSAGPFVGLGICQIIFGFTNAIFGTIYVANNWDCGYYGFCPRYHWPMYAASGMWSGLLLIIAGSVACATGGYKSKGCANGTIASSVFSMVASACCIGFTAVDLHWFEWRGYWRWDRDYLLAVYITLISCSTLAFIFSIVLIALGAKGVSSTGNAVYPGVPMWGMGGGMMPTQMMPAMQPMRNQPATQPLMNQPQPMPAMPGMPGVPGMVDKDTKQLVIPTTDGPMIFVPKQSRSELVEME